MRMGVNHGRVLDNELRLDRDYIMHSDKEDIVITLIALILYLCISTVIIVHEMF
jgi:hypothetical protein